MKKKQVLYIMGAGRSGTTLLDIVLGNQKELFSCGEINRFPIRKGIPPLLENKSRIEFWRKIKEELVNNFKIQDFNYLIKLLDNFEYHFGYIKSLFYKSKTEYADYTKYLSDFFQIVFDNIDQDIIIDSSKYPGRLFQLSKLSYNLKIIYLIREPSAVLKSFEKEKIEQPSKHWTFAIIYYFLVNLLCQMTLFFLNKDIKIIKIKYEEFIDKPTLTIRNIADTLELDLNNLIHKLEKNEKLIVGNLFDGNRIRLQEEIQIIGANQELPTGIKYTFARVLNRIFYK